MCEHMMEMLEELMATIGRFSVACSRSDWSTAEAYRHKAEDLMKEMKRYGTKCSDVEPDGSGSGDEDGACEEREWVDADVHDVRGAGAPVSSLPSAKQVEEASKATGLTPAMVGRVMALSRKWSVPRGTFKGRRRRRKG